MAGRPRKNTLIGEPEQLDTINKDISYETKDLHQMFRVIARGMPQGGSQLISEVDAEVTAWLRKGYRLQQSFMLATLPEGYQMLYVLVRD